MKTKFNSRFSTSDMTTGWHGSYIQRFLEAEVNYLLAPSVSQLSQVEFEKIYIPNPDLERSLSRYKTHTYSNNTCVITGLTGSGKTMLIRHVFDIHGIKPHIDGKSIIIPFNFDNALYGGVKDVFTRMTRAACDCLKKEFPNLHDIDEYKEDFYDFIASRRNDLLYVLEKYPSATKFEQLASLCETNAFAFYSCEFKFYLNQTDICPIDNVVLIIDDVEGIRVEVKTEDSMPRELLPIKVTLELIECLQNQDGIPVPWSLNTIICCRHFVYRLMGSLPYSLSKNYTQCLESYAICSQYDLRESPSLVAIIQKRYEAIPETKRNTIDSKWYLAMQVVMKIVNRVDDNIGDFVLDLTLKNIREALRKVKEIVFNKQWIQRNLTLHSPGAFQITDIDQYRTNPASLIRALGMNESIVYNSRESIIPNLLYNEVNNNMELFPLLTLKYFLYFADYREMSWDSSIRISDFLQDVEEVFGSKKYLQHFNNSLRYLMEHRLLLRSADQEQISNSDLCEQDIKSTEFVYVPSLSVALWGFLGRTSVFFEMFVDDIWLDNMSRETQRPFFRGFDYENYRICLDYLGELIDAETTIFSQAINNQGNGQKFFEIFGDKPICDYLLDGLENSLNAFFREEQPEFASIVTTWREKIRMLRNECGKIYD